MADYSIRSALGRDTLCVQSLLRQLGYPLSTAEVEDQIELYTSSDARGLLVADSVETAQPTVIGLVAFSKTPLFVKKPGESILRPLLSMPYSVIKASVNDF